MADYRTDVEAVSYGPLIGLDTESASPPTSAYIGRDDTLAVNMSCATVGIPITVQARLLLPDGTIVPNQWRIFSNGSRTGTYVALDLTESFLLSMTVTVNASVNNGAVFVSVALIRGNIAGTPISQVLIAGYVTNLNPLGWPAMTPANSTAGRGLIRSITGTTPPNGAEISETVPISALWRLIAFSFQLNTSAAAGTRIPFLAIDDGTHIFTQINPPGTVGPGAVGSYWYADGLQVTTQAPYFNGPLPSQLYLEPGYRIRTTSSALTINDQYSAVQYLVEEWMNG